jgi:putative restriction endonuclease
MAFNLYCKLRFGQCHARNPEVVALAELLGRTPAAVAMKLVNFASFDPAHQARGVRGLGNAARLDRQIWDEFNHNWEELAVESERALAGLGQVEEQDHPPAGLSGPDAEEFGADSGARPTEGGRWTRVRLAQAFFRRAVLASYGSSCCICRLATEPLLVASHIVPWATRIDLRVNPRNGMCLCALHDRAFDRGLISVDVGLIVRVSPQLSSLRSDRVVAQMFLGYADSPITLPEKFQPDPEYLAYHFQTIFQAA